MKRLEGKTAIVTGSGQGIGRAIAIAFAKEGANVTLATRTVSRAEDAVKEIEEFGGSAIAVSCDVKDHEQVKAAVRKTVETFGTVDILVNNAQQFIWDKPFMEYTDEDLDVVFHSGYRATFWFMKECMPIMAEKKYGKIINTASAAGIFSTPGTVAYASNKEAIRAMTRVAAREWGPLGINCNCIAPVADTVSMTDAQRAVLPQMAALQRIPSLEEIANVAIFLASDDSSCMTGITMMADAGCIIDAAR